jgi:hypothetical protein
MADPPSPRLPPSLKLCRTGRRRSRTARQASWRAGTRDRQFFVKGAPIKTAVNGKNLFIPVRRTGTTATGEGDAVGAKPLSTHFPRLPTAATLASAGGDAWQGGRGGFATGGLRGVGGHGLAANPSAMATALRMAMDLLMVSWNSPSGVESFTQPPPAWT